MSDRKKRLLKISSVALVVLVGLFLVSVILEAVVRKGSDIETDYEFYCSEEEENIFEDREYLAKDRSLHYTDEMGQMTPYTDEMVPGEVGAAFFKLYFFALEQGDAQTLNSLYSKEYIDNHGAFESFTPQRVYAREVKYMYDSVVDDSTFSITYSLDYNIMKNDGSFRRDIGSDMSRTQYVTLYYNSEGEAWIESVSFEYRR